MYIIFFCITFLFFFLVVSSRIFFLPSPPPDLNLSRIHNRFPSGLPKKKSDTPSLRGKKKHKGREGTKKKKKLFFFFGKQQN